MEFKKGDRVKHKDGWIGEVENYISPLNVNIRMLEPYKQMDVGYIYKAWADYLTIIPKYKTGDRVLVRERDELEWEERVFVCEYNGKYWCIVGEDGCFGDWLTSGNLNAWQQIKPLEEKLDIDLTCTVNGEKVPLSDISEETLLAIRNKSK